MKYFVEYVTDDGTIQCAEFDNRVEQILFIDEVIETDNWVVTDTWVEE